MLETSVRLLRLLSLLQAPRVWSGPELADRLGVTTRTVRTDVTRLRELGYEVVSHPGATGGYRLGAGSTPPPLLLDDEEVVAVAVGLRAAASGSVTGIEETSLRALAKLEQTMPSRLRHRVDALRSATVSAAGRGPTVDADVLAAVATASTRHERLRFDYVGHDGTATTRDVEPYRLVYTGRRWYLVAWDTGRSQWRTFRADRINPRVPTGPRFVPREPPDDDVGAHVVRGTGSLGWPHPVRVRLHTTAGALSDLVPPAAGVLTPRNGGTCELETGGATLASVAGFLASLDVPFDVLEPAELREVLARLATRLDSAAQGPAT